MVVMVMMMDSIALNIGLFVDENNRICLIDPNVENKSTQLQNNIHMFLESLYCLFLLLLLSPFTTTNHIFDVIFNQLLFIFIFFNIFTENEDFKKIVSNFIVTLGNVGDQIEREKFKVSLRGNFLFNWKFF